MKKTIVTPEDFKTRPQGIIPMSGVNKYAKTFVQTFKDKGVDVDQSDIVYVLYPWLHGWSAGKVNAKRGYFIESKIAWKGLRIEVTPIDKAKNARNYIA